MGLLLNSCTEKSTQKSPPKSQDRDLTIWWSQGFYPEEDQALETAIEQWQQQENLKVNLKFVHEDDLLPLTLKALEDEAPPDILFSVRADFIESPRWAWQGDLLDVSELIEPVKSRYSASALESVQLFNHKANQRAYYAVPIEQQTIHIHYWRDLLAEAGFSETDIPQDWENFWNFWKQVQNRLREKGKEDIYGLGLTYSTQAVDTFYQFEQMLEAYDVEIVDREGNLQVDRPEIRKGIVQTLDWFTRFYREGYVPENAIAWLDADNNASFLNRQVVMTLNPTLSIPGSQRSDPQVYREEMATIPFPKEPDGDPPNYIVGVKHALIFTTSPQPEAAKNFLAFLIQPDRLGKYVKGASGRWFPVMPELWQDPFWNDREDPHVAVAAQQFRAGHTRPSYPVFNPAYARVQAENVWGRAISRILNEGWTAEKAADEAIANIKAIVNDW
ncbi:ABC transporter substrate-binding protein [Spirulina sp. 06S082]|uniref:ABC transporter substrate-binding protein n=1 Tax=Spirulina sp. 06S082 TaxID=3110248 RepID=UPI002B21236B|nr:ABC transporter substrate-binding protein [Spirulina sp. 06S082]MEA5468563.1 ABC transporter substrate-binding protein [Spirulina sp. 06S082]